MKKALLSAVFGWLILAHAAQAQELQGSYGDWNVFTLNENSKKLCYIATAPVKEQGNYKKRGEPYLLVTHRSAKVEEVSVSSGYPYKKGSNVTFTVDGGRKYQLFTTTDVPEIAWARDSATDSKLVSSMKKGLKLDVRGTSRLGTYSIDTYSLTGFSNAFKKMKSLCQ